MGRKNYWFTTITILIFAVSSFSQRAAPTPKSSLDEQIQAAIAGFEGKVWIYAKNLDTGKDYGVRADEQTRTASTIKLAIMAEAFRQVADGKLNWSDEIVLTKDKKVGGSGILFEFSDNTKIDLKTAVHLMIVVSDNTATNLVLDKVGADNVNDYMDSLGLANIKSMRKVFGTEFSRAGSEPANKLFGLGRSSPRDMVKLVEMMELGRLVSKAASAEMIEILKRQQFKDGIGRSLPDTIPSASKSGALDRLRSDVGIIYTRRGRIAMAITVDDMRVVAYDEDNPGLLMLWKLSQILQDGLGK